MALGCGRTRPTVHSNNLHLVYVLDTLTLPYSVVHRAVNVHYCVVFAGVSIYQLAVCQFYLTIASLHSLFNMMANEFKMLYFLKSFLRVSSS